MLSEFVILSGAKDLLPARAATAAYELTLIPITGHFAAAASLPPTRQTQSPAYPGT